MTCSKMAIYFDLILFSLFWPSYIIYLIFLITLHRFRHRKPFNSSCFRLLFYLGVIDIIHMTDGLLQYKLAGQGWGYDKIVMKAPEVFGKIHTLISWYSAKAQIVGIVLLTVNRVAAVAYFHTWTAKQTRYCIVACWVLPLFINLPLWGHTFYFSNNGTVGAAVKWDNEQFNFQYLAFCAFLCAGVGCFCAICYIFIFYKTYKNRRSAHQKVKKAEIKLLVVGLILTVLACECGFACIMMAYSQNQELLDRYMPWFTLGSDLLDWVNPYCLIIVSSTVRKHVKATVFCMPVNQVTSNSAFKSHVSTFEQKQANQLAVLTPVEMGSMRYDSSRLTPMGSMRFDSSRCSMRSRNSATV